MSGSHEEEYVASLERQLAAVRSSYTSLAAAHETLHAEVRRLRSDNLGLQLEVSRLRYVRRWLRWFSRLTFTTQ